MRFPSALSRPWAGPLAVALSLVMALWGLGPLVPEAMAAEATAAESVLLAAGERTAAVPGGGEDAESGASAATLAHGAQLFEAHCVGCHVGGGNIIRRGRTLKLQALQRNGLDSAAAIASEGLAIARHLAPTLGGHLGDGGAADVAAWVWQQALSGWQAE
jgi:mono/diheme cytochrome c family protein